MGTNFYAKAPGKEQKHIGKSSCGWTFALHVYPEQGINDWADWERLLSVPRVKVVDEYGHTITLPNMAVIVTLRVHDTPVSTPKGSSFKGTLDEWLDLNHAVIGPNNLLRARVDGEHCIGHGEGTWDLIQGDFS